MSAPESDCRIGSEYLDDGMSHAMGVRAAEEFLNRGEDDRGFEETLTEWERSLSEAEPVFAQLLRITRDFCRSLPTVTGIFRGGEEKTRTLELLCGYLSDLSGTEEALSACMRSFSEKQYRLENEESRLWRVEEGLTVLGLPKDGEAWERFRRLRGRVERLKLTLAARSRETADWRSRILPEYREQVLEKADLLHNGASCQSGAVAVLSGSLEKLLNDRTIFERKQSDFPKIPQTS